MQVGDRFLNPAGISPLLQELPHWLAWTLREDPEHPEKPLKVPIGPGGNDCNAGSPSSWQSYGAALQTMTQYGLSGIGFCPKQIWSDDGAWKLCILDLDNITPEMAAQRLLAYDLKLEITPSGNGVRALFWLPGEHPVVTSGKAYRKLTWPEGTKAGEVFIHGGYCTVTGNALTEPETQYHFLQGLPAGLVPVETKEAGYEDIGTVHWTADVEPLKPEGLTGKLWEIFNGSRDHNRSDHMLYLLATISWQCDSAEELCTRAWATEHLHQYFVDHRSARAEEYQQEFCAGECAKAWYRRNEHMPLAQQFEVAQAETQEDDYVWHTKHIAHCDFKPPAWLVEGVVVDNGANMFFGAPNMGKSMLHQSLAVSIARGDPDWHGHKVNRRGVVLYMPSEDKAGTVNRLEQMMKDDPTIPIIIHTMETELTEEEVVTVASEMIKHCESCGFELAAVILDVYIGYATVESENDAIQTKRFLRRVQQSLALPKEAALIIAHHAKKAGGTRGSSAIDGFFDIMWSVDSKGTFIEATPAKVKNYSKLQVPPFCLEIVHDKQGRIELKPAVAPAMDEEGNIVTPEENAGEVPYWQWVMTEKTIHKLVRERSCTSRSRLMKGPEYKKAREMAMQTTSNKNNHPLPASNLAPVVQAMLDAGIIKEEPNGRGTLLTTDRMWTDADTESRLSAACMRT